MKTKKKKRCKKVIRCFVIDKNPIQQYSGGLIGIYAATFKNSFYNCPAKITIEWTEP